MILRPQPRSMRRGLGVGSITLVALALGAPVHAQDDGVDPQAFEALRRGNEHFDKGRLTSARQEYRDAVGRAPQFGRALINLGIVEVLLGRTEEGRASCSRVRSPTGEDLAKVEYCLGLADARDKKDELAGPHLRRALELLPKLVAARTELAQISERAGRIEEALAQYLEITELEPQVPGHFVRLGYCYKRLSRWKEAAGAYERALAIAPDDYFAHLNLGVALVRLRDDKAAEQHFVRATQIDADRPEPHYNLGNLCLRQERYAEAYRAYRKTVALAPKDPENHFALARAAWHLGDRAEAGRALDRASAEGPAPALAEAIARMREQMSKHEKPPKRVKVLRPGKAPKKEPAPGGQTPRP